MSAPVRLGMLTPSSNTVLEPVTAAMLADLAPAGGAPPEVTAHFARFRVTRIGLTQGDQDQFAAPAILAAADLLADAEVDVIAWNGTSASWLGFERDERLRAAIAAGTGIAACTAVLAFRDVFAATGVRRVGLVTPYTGDVQARIAAN